MKIKDFALPFVCGFVVPLVLLGLAVRTREAVPEETTSPEVTEQAVAEETVRVLTDTGAVEEMVLDDYLTGVVLGEMPAGFEPEALKAQAVVARTYTMKRVSSGSKHETAAICTDSGCCQSYTSPENYLARGGAQESVEKVAQAVADTAGLVVTYEGALIDATYFSCSGGSTEAAVAVWGSDVPYLQAVDSPGEENAAHYTDEVSFTSAEFADKLGLAGTGDPADWFGAVTYTDGGGVDTIEICGAVYGGTELRSLLGLRSTAFAVTVSGDTITIETKGYGHRVGMSQYGAQAMAQSGSTFEEILTYYYQGTRLEQISG